MDEQGVDANGRVLVEVDSRYFRPAEVDLLLGDASKAHAELGWRPRVGFEQLVTMMVDADLADGLPGQRPQLQRSEFGRDRG